MSGAKLCLSVTPPAAPPEKTVKGALKNGVLIPEKTSDLPLVSHAYIYMPDEKIYCSVRERKNEPGHFDLSDIWGGALTEKLTDRDSFDFAPVPTASMSASDGALSLLAQITRDKADACGLTRPVSWIQLGGFGILTMKTDAFKRVYAGSFGYKAADTPPPAEKFIGEPDPDNMKRFQMKWGNFSDDGLDLKTNKKLIADGFALRRVMFGHCHFPRDAAFQPYLEKVDGILSWCKEKGVPVMTMAQSGEYLYGTGRAEVNGNLLPRIDIDLDGNGVPDGFTKAAPLDMSVKLSEELPGALVSTGPGVIASTGAFGGVKGGAKHVLSLKYKCGPGVKVSAQLKTMRGLRFVSGDSAAPFVLPENSSDEWKDWRAELSMPEFAAAGALTVSAEGKDGASIACLKLERAK